MSTVKTLARAVLGSGGYDALKRRYWRSNLSELAMLYGTDKWGLHRYAQHYQKHFWTLRNRPISLLEIGVGGHADPAAGGQSLRMWKAFFPKGRIYGIDLHDKRAHEEDRIRIFQGSQADPDFLRGVIDEIGSPDIIIDDGSHICEHVSVSFQTLFPLLRENGIYAIEDLQTSYWKEFGGSWPGRKPHTSMEMLKEMVDGLNWEEIVDRPEAAFDRSIVEICFYHNLAFIRKGKNAEGTNVSNRHIVG